MVDIIVGLLTRSGTFLMCGGLRGNGLWKTLIFFPGLSGWLSDRESTASAGDAGDTGLIPSPERSPGVGNGNPRQYSCLENSVDGEGWQAEVHRVARSQTWLSAAQHNFLSTTFSEWIITSLKWGGSYCFWHRMRMHWIYETWSCKQSTHMEEQGWAREGGSDKLSLSFCALSAACGLPCHCLCFFFSFWCITFPLVRIRSGYFWDRECTYSFNLLLLATCLPLIGFS